jgi:hypothetical protein
MQNLSEQNRYGYTVQVVIPTLNRPEGLERMLASVRLHSPEVECIVARERGPLPLIINGLFAATTADIVIWAGDSCEWTSDVVGICCATMAERFPDLDGCLGLYQTNLDDLENIREFCFMAVGRRFINRFPGAAVFCPLYDHFCGDTELGLYAKSLGRFHYERRATCLHHIPGYSPLGSADDTHRRSHRVAGQDLALYESRQKNGILWGQQFDGDDATERRVWRSTAAAAQQHWSTTERTDA